MTPEVKRPKKLRGCETVHFGDFCQNAVACASAQAQRFEVNFLDAHSGDEFSNILLDGLRGLWVAGGIKNLVKPEDIVFMFLDRLAVDLFTARWRVLIDQAMPAPSKR